VALGAKRRWDRLLLAVVVQAQPPDAKGGGKGAFNEMKQKVTARYMILMVRNLNASFQDGKQHVTAGPATAAAQRLQWRPKRARLR
jgi:hypothetical protein